MLRNTRGCADDDARPEPPPAPFPSVMLLRRRERDADAADDPSAALKRWIASDHVRLTRSFLEDPQRFLRHLLDGD